VPSVQVWRAKRAIDHEKTVTQYKQGLVENIEQYNGDTQELVETAKDAHKSELDRNTHLDSKAGNYLANLGVVLSILSLGPVFSIVLGFEQSDIVIGWWPESLVLLFFGFAVVSLLGSAYYSSRALKMRGYSAYFTANGIKEQIEDGEDPDNTEQIRDLLVCKKRNELHNQDKNNLISVAEEFSRNGLISLGLGISVIVLELASVDLLQLVAEVVCLVF
jgi:hypothetical protein